MKSPPTVSSSAIAIVGLGAATIFLSLGVVVATGWWRPGLGVEAVWYFALLTALSAVPQFRRLFTRLPRLQQLALLGLSLALLAGQFVGGGGDTFPVVRWAMFTDQVDGTGAVIYIGITESGKSILLHPADLVPSLAHGRFDSKLGQAYESSLGSSLAPGTTEFDQLLRTIALVHDRGGSGDPIVTVEVLSYSVPTGDYQDRSLHETRQLWRTDV